MTTRTRKQDTFAIFELSEMFGLTPFDKIDDLNHHYYAEIYAQVEREARREGLSSKKAEQQALKAEQSAKNELFSGWSGAVEYVARKLFEQHGLELSNVKRGRTTMFKVYPTESWEKAARKILSTINGFGMFEFNSLNEFLNSGPYTAREAVLSHLVWVKHYPEVYGGTSAERLFELRMK